MLNHTLSSPPRPPPPPGSNHRVTSSAGGRGLPGDHAQYQLPPAPPPPSGQHRPANGNTGQAWALTQRELEVHQLLQMLKQDGDAESAYSGEGSNTDSGRGPSEEGEGPRLHTDAHTAGGAHPHHEGERGNSQEGESFGTNQSSLNQVVPNVAGHSFSSSNFSYSSQPTQLRTFAPNNYSVSTSPSNEFLKKSAPSRMDDLKPDVTKSIKPKSSMPPPPPPPPPSCPIDATQLDLETPQSQIGANYIRKFYNGRAGDGERAAAALAYSNRRRNLSGGGHDSIMDSVGTESELSDDDDAGNGQYSCADMSDALHGCTATPHALQVLDTIPDDAESTTTSGSYVVDPQELVNEIDDLFFRDMMM